MKSLKARGFHAREVDRTSRAGKVFALAAALLTCAGPLSASGASPQPAAGGGPLYDEVVREFDGMTATSYQHRTSVDPVAGTYRYDCVGLVSYALKHAAPQAWASAFKGTGIAKGRIPSPARYRAFFAGLAAAPQPGWTAVTKASDLRPGDVVVWEHQTASSTGHAVIIGGTPKPLPDGSWQVKVFDSTSSPHGRDSRPADERARVLPSSGRPSGLGNGVMVFTADPATGALTGLRWSPNARAIVVPIAAGRPTS